MRHLPEIRAQTMTPVTAELPTERFDAATAFAKVGVDYFGPFTVKIGRRNEIRWCCLFTCLKVQAVHIEIVPKLDTDSCLNAIMRFIGRRGKPIKLISDNGTNFAGADREFKEYVAAWNKERIEEHLVQQGIRWKFNPPAAPHFGSVGKTGQKLHESNVRSVGEPINYGRCSFNKNVCCSADVECNTLDTSQFGCK